MSVYLAKRLIGAVPTLFLLALVTFVLMHATPGGPFDAERALPAEIEARLQAQYRLDEPLPVQFGHYLWQLAQGDLGPSFQYREYSVNELIAGGLPVSALLGGTALLLALAVGLPAGAAAALWHNRRADRWLSALTMLGICLPAFVVLPVLTLALPQIAYITRLSRGSLLEIQSSPWLRAARAHGVPGTQLLWRHMLRPMLLPVVSYLGPAAAGILTGSVVVEEIFGLPGIGRYFVQGALNRDYTLVMGVVLFYGALIILFNLLVDLAYAGLDPRVRRR